MKLNKALKAKNKLTKKLNDHLNNFISNNSAVVGRKREFDPEVEFNNYLEVSKQLTELKTKIQIANAPILSKIYEMAEKKSLVSKLRNLPVKEGEYDNYGDKPLVYNSFINAERKRSLVNTLEDEIEALQEEIDTFNATTSI